LGTGCSQVKVCIVGGAGFIGSHLTDRLLGDESTEQVTLFDNFTSGREWHFQHHLADERLRVVRADVGDLAALTAAVADHNLVIHLASNPDIAKAMTSPRIDFDEGTALTFHVAEAARLAGVGEILYASGSGVYGDLGELEITEDHGPLAPSSTYGASKLAGEALLSSYAAMFGIAATAFRFGNVVGPRQTHGVGFDFVRRLRRKPEVLEILGDGRQSKSYVYVEDVVNAILMMRSTREKQFEAFNVATGDYITVTEIALLALQVLGLTEDATELRYAGGDRGWKGDVPIVRLSTDRIRARGWTCGHTSKEALIRSMSAMVSDDERGRLTT
jgi:UDP-glucose 4-epimerase